MSDGVSTFTIYNTTLQTTLMSVRYKDGIVIGADGRSANVSVFKMLTMFLLQSMFVGNKVSDKLEPVHQRIYVQRAGTSAHTQAIARQLRAHVDAQAKELCDFPSVRSAASILQRIIYNSNLSAHMFCSGWDPYEGYQIYDVNSTGFMNAMDCAIGGSGGTYIKGYADENYRPDMTRDEAREFIQNSIALACYNDTSSGGCIRMITITKEAIQREFIPYTDFKKK